MLCSLGFAASSWTACKHCEVTPEIAGKFASLVAWQRCDARTRDGAEMRSADDLMKMIQNHDLPEAL